jgi:hypothetical protein
MGLLRASDSILRTYLYQNETVTSLKKSALPQEKRLPGFWVPATGYVTPEFSEHLQQAVKSGVTQPVTGVIYSVDIERIWWDCSQWWQQIQLFSLNALKIAFIFVECPDLVNRWGKHIA